MSMLRSHPILTSIAAVVLLLVAWSLVSPAGDLSIAAIGGAVVVAFGVVIYRTLRAHPTPS